MSGTAERRGPRFVYLCDAKDPELPDARFGWRLLAANNRPLGRGIHVEASLEACRAAARRLHDESGPSITSGVQFSPNRGLWHWRVTIAELAVAVCVHPYLRRVECLRALNQFLAAARAADPDDGPVKCFGPTSLRAYDPVRAARDVS